MIPFNKPFLTGQETTYISDAVASQKISGDGVCMNRETQDHIITGVRNFFVEKRRSAI